MEIRLLLAAVFSIICASIPCGAADSQVFQTGTGPNKQEKCPALLDAIFSKSINAAFGDWFESENPAEVSAGKSTERMDSSMIGRKKRSIVTFLKSLSRVNKALNFLKKDGFLVSKKGRTSVWVKIGGAKRADKDFSQLNPAIVSTTTVNGVKTIKGSFEGGELALKKELKTHASTIVFSKLLADGDTYEFSVKYYNMYNGSKVLDKH